MLNFGDQMRTGVYPWWQDVGGIIITREDGIIISKISHLRMFNDIDKIVEEDIEQ